MMVGTLSIIADAKSRYSTLRTSIKNVIDGLSTDEARGIANSSIKALFNEFSPYFTSLCKRAKALDEKAEVNEKAVHSWANVAADVFASVFAEAQTIVNADGSQSIVIKGSPEELVEKFEKNINDILKSRQNKGSGKAEGTNDTKPDSNPSPHSGLPDTHSGSTMSDSSSDDKKKSSIRRTKNISDKNVSGVHARINELLDLQDKAKYSEEMAAIFDELSVLRSKLNQLEPAEERANSPEATKATVVLLRTLSQSLSNVGNSLEERQIKAHYNLSDGLDYPQLCGMPAYLGSSLSLSEFSKILLLAGGLNIPLHRVLQSAVPVKHLLGHSTARDNVYKGIELDLSPVYNLLQAIQNKCGIVVADETGFPVREILKQAEEMRKAEESGNGKPKPTKGVPLPSTSPEILAKVTPLGHIDETLGFTIVTYALMHSRTIHEIERLIGEADFDCIVCDGFNGYESLGVKIQRCLVHARRKMFDALYSDYDAIQLRKEPQEFDKQWLNSLNQMLECKDFDFLRVFIAAECLNIILKLDTLSKDLPLYRVKELRDEISRPALTLLGNALKPFVKRCVPVKKASGGIKYCATGKTDKFLAAAVYALNLLEFEHPFLDDPRIPPHSNAAESALRVIALMRNSSHFFTSKRGAECMCVLLTIAGTAKANGVELSKFLENWLGTCTLVQHGNWIAKLKSECKPVTITPKGYRINWGKLCQGLNFAQPVQELLGRKLFSDSIVISYEDCKDIATATATIDRLIGEGLLVVQKPWQKHRPLPAPSMAVQGEVVLDNVLTKVRVRE